MVGGMKACYFDLESRSVADVVPDHDLFEPAKNVVILTRINVPQSYRQQGIGSRLLKEILFDADKEGIKIALHISSYGEMTYKNLADWYERNGFVQSSNGWFFREPIREHA